MTPSVSILIPTFARVGHLKECLYTALNQIYSNFEVVVFNDCADQRLVVNDPRVRVVNEADWIPIIGDKRNRMIEMASGEILVTFDDDDLLFSNHISEHVKNITSNNVDASLGMDCLYWERKSGNSKRGHAGIDIVFRKRDGLSFPSREIDFDTKMRDLIVKSWSYSELHLEIPTYLYCWDNNSFHISGTGIMKDFIRDARRRLDSGVEPVGEVIVVPELQSDVVEFMSLHSKK